MGFRSLSAELLHPVTVRGRNWVDGMTWSVELENMLVDDDQMLGSKGQRCHDSPKQRWLCVFISEGEMQKNY